MFIFYINTLWYTTEKEALAIVNNKMFYTENHILASVIFIKRYFIPDKKDTWLSHDIFCVETFLLLRAIENGSLRSGHHFGNGRKDDLHKSFY